MVPMPSGQVSQCGHTRLYDHQGTVGLPSPALSQGIEPKGPGNTVMPGLNSRTPCKAGVQQRRLAGSEAACKSKNPETMHVGCATGASSIAGGTWITAGVSVPVCSSAAASASTESWMHEGNGAQMGTLAVTLARSGKAGSKRR